MDTTKWELVKNDYKCIDGVLTLVKEHSKEYNLVMIVGFNSNLFTNKPEWQVTALASKPRSGYLKCLGQYYKVYPNGNIKQYIGYVFGKTQWKNIV